MVDVFLMFDPSTDKRTVGIGSNEVGRLGNGGLFSLIVQPPMTRGELAALPGTSTYYNETDDDIRLIQIAEIRGPEGRRLGHELIWRLLPERQFDVSAFAQQIGAQTNRTVIEIDTTSDPKA